MTKPPPRVKNISFFLPKLVEYAKKNFDQEVLDEWVCELFSARASAVNNEGPEAQVQALLDGMGVKGVRDLFEMEEDE